MDNFGNRVYRVLDAKNRQWGLPIFQPHTPPLHSEINLISQVEAERLTKALHTSLPSGFFTDPTRAEDDFLTDPNWANLFKFGGARDPFGSLEADESDAVVWASINGWVVPVTGTNAPDGDVSNHIKLYPPPSSGYRIDFVFLEAWAAVVSANPSAVNKPTASTIWKYGNTQFGGTNLADDLIDNRIRLETTKRVQIQYRIRVHGQGTGAGGSVALDVYPDGLTDPNILGQGAKSSPVVGLTWTNMRETLGDSSLWRAGDGDPNNDLGTVDGYTYAIPICAVFRRNSGAYVAVTNAGSPNQMGAFNRTPTSSGLPNPLDGARELDQASLASSLDHDTDGVAIVLTNLSSSGLEDSHVVGNLFLKIDDEIVGVSAIDTGAGTVTLNGRGLYGTAASGHVQDALVSFYTTNPSGLYADQVAPEDILDLRRSVTVGEWDYQRLLEASFSKLLHGELKTAWKHAGTGSSTGVVTSEVSYLYADGGVAVPAQTDAVDGPDGIRTVWSDAAVFQPDVTILLDNEAAKVNGGVGLTNATQLDTTVEWDVGPDFKPIGYFNTGGALPANSWCDGSHIQLFIGGANGSGGARGTFRDGSERAVRFLTPREFWKTGYPIVDWNTSGNQHPITLRFLDQRGLEAPPVSVPNPEYHPGPMYPWREANFEAPFLVLGGVLNSALKFNAVPTANMQIVGSQLEISLPEDFDVPGTWYTLDTNGGFENDPNAVANSLQNGRRTLYGMLTANGTDRTGASSEVYVLTYGDSGGRFNNGAFRVVGVGTTGMTHYNAANANSIVVTPVCKHFAGSFDSNANTVTVEFRSQDHFADDISDWAGRTGDLAIVITDIGGTGDYLSPLPWTRALMGDGEPYDVSLPVSVESKALVSLSLLYSPGRGATTRVPNTVDRIALRGGAVSQTVGAYLRQAPGVVDPSFEANTGAPSDETYFDPANHVSLWNRLSSRGWHAPTQVSYGGEVIGFTEQDRESESFVDPGSKTLVFRPFRDRQMTLKGMTFAEIPGGSSLLGDLNYPSAVAKDSLSLCTSGKKMGFPVPREWMPRFGRQDIPYYQDVSSGSGPFLEGINHLFVDSATLDNPVFSVIGGEDNITTGAQVKPIFFVTNEPGTNYGESSTTIGTVLNKPFYGARKTSDLNPVVPYAQDIIDRLRAVNSSDFGRGLEGIQLPPYVGIARLYGVYERADYEAKGGRTWQSNRYLQEADPATNLLRRDANRQTLFILQDGAKDLTTEDDDHTYIIPSNVLDLTRIPTYNPGDAFSDFEYVIEATVFVFAKGWINKNNFVLARNHNALGDLISDGDDPELEGIHMVIPCAAGLNDQVYVGYQRTVYQGDPFGTRNGATRTLSDYTPRYGQLTLSQQEALSTAIQQYDTAGAFVPQVSNPRAFQVLASLDFTTTLGTGKVGGPLCPGTFVDVGHTEVSSRSALRRPEAGQPSWNIVPRAFTEGQKRNVSRARALLELLDNTAFGEGTPAGQFYPITFHLLDGTKTTLYGVTTSLAETELMASGVPGIDIFDIDTGTVVQLFENETLNFGNLTLNSPSEIKTVVVPGALPGSAVTVNPWRQSTPASLGDLGNAKGRVIFDAWCDTADTVNVRAVYTANPTAFEVFADNVVSYNLTWSPIAPQTSSFQTILWSGAAIGDVVTVTPQTHTANFIHWGLVVAPGQINIHTFNLSPVVTDTPNGDYSVAVLKDVTVADWTYNVPSLDFVVTVHQPTGVARATLQSLIDLVNQHPDLTRSVRASFATDTMVEFEAIPTGAEGNGIAIEIGYEERGGFSGTPVTEQPLAAVLKLRTATNNNMSIPTGLRPILTRANLSGGQDYPYNAGAGNSQLAVTGLTERLPLGALVQDSDFLGEAPLGDSISPLRVFPGGLTRLQTVLPLTQGGKEYSRFTGAAGELIALSDGHICTTAFGAYTTGNPTGTRKFRLYRGGGSAYLLGGAAPGGPLDWVTASYPKESRPVLKGAILAGKALLVKNFYEEALSGPSAVSQGDEIQMVILTNTIFGSPSVTENGLVLAGIISPSGYGEGYAAADRYLLPGRPMVKSWTRRVRNPASIPLAVYPETSRQGTSLDI